MLWKIWQGAIIAAAYMVNDSLKLTDNGFAVGFL